VKPAGRFDGARRRCLARIAAASLAPLGCARSSAHASIGPVEPPLPAPAVRLVDHERRVLTLAQLLRGRVSALQSMFTGCSTVCPLQGAMFASVQEALSSAPLEHRQLVSISIDPLGDTPQSLQAWRLRFGAGDDWIAALPAAADLDALQRAFGDARPEALDRHSTQVLFFDADARLRWRSGELPSAREVLAVLRQLD
jgi:protein SCO1/2